ncbi:hypothetical protein Dimus_035670, partial [Dionaea muscipula]
LLEYDQMDPRGGLLLVSALSAELMNLLVKLEQQESRSLVLDIHLSIEKLIIRSGFPNLCDLIDHNFSIEVLMSFYFLLRVFF